MSEAPTTRAAALAVILAACAGASCSDASPSMCDGVGSQSSAATAEARWLLGLASRYPADTTLAGRRDELARSQRARRTAAWRAVLNTLSPVPLAQPTPVDGATVPRFRTWYDREDVMRTFQRLYGALTPEQRAAGERFSDAALDEAFGWNVNFINTLPEWPTSRLNDFARTFDSATRLAAVSGVQRIGMSPDVVRHVMSSYPELLRCLNNGAPESFVDGAPAPQQLAREPVTLSRCGTQTFGPYFVATGGSLAVRITDATSATLRVYDGVASTAAVRCTATAAQGCTLAGPGTFVVRATTLAEPASGMLDVRYTPPGVNVTPCLHGVFPAAAATVAMEWRRVGIGETFPRYDTSGAAINRRLRAGATWGMGDGTAEPDERSVYTLRLPSGNTFRLAGMHIRTREVDQWLNITLWWSPEPDTDFGADRPEAVRALGAPWNSYKMCVAMDFTEGDADPDGGFAQDAPSLAAALRAVHEGRGGPSWCSNPYIDAAPGLVHSNCVGCHQHAFSGVRPIEVVNDLVHYPFHGRMQTRNNFPADGFWGIDAGDQLGAVIAETAAYYRTTR